MINFIFSFPKWLRVLLSLLYLAIVARLSLMAQEDIPDLELFPGFDKLVHGLMYFGLTILACWSFHAEKQRSYIVYILLFAIAWGLLMEVAQLQMQAGRAFEWKDELSNSIGALLGAFIYAFFTGIYRKGQGG